MKLELGQRVYDAQDWPVGGFGTIVARSNGVNIEFFENYGNDPRVKECAKSWLNVNNLEGRILLTDDGIPYYSWTEDPELTEIND